MKGGGGGEGLGGIICLFAMDGAVWRVDLASRPASETME